MGVTQRFIDRLIRFDYFNVRDDTKQKLFEILQT
jgi:hypothetical protein